MARHRVKCLLMGGQACVFYGAAEFSRDSDFAILADGPNLARLGAAMESLRAEVIAVPPFDGMWLQRGHAVHFRCAHPDCAGLRVDVMSVMRGVDSFQNLWGRRTTLELADGTLCHLLSIPDLVRAKKTQRDKDWPMIRRLMEADFFAAQDSGEQHPRFWLLELRTEELLTRTARDFPELASELSSSRPLLKHAVAGEVELLSQALAAEETAERHLDRDYWLPLKRELEMLRRRK